MSVTDYYARFIQLAKFTMQCDVPNEAAKANKFQRGLKPEYMPTMASHDQVTVEQVHEAALRLEKERLDARRRTDYSARCETDDHLGKR